MPSEVREKTVDAIIISAEMLPERYVMNWYEAVWEGPASRQQAVLFSFLDRMMDHGFGRVRKGLLSASTPAQLAEKAPDLWRRSRHGDLDDLDRDGVTTVVLQDHLYTTAPLARLACAEIYRYALSLAKGARSPTQVHRLERDGSLRIRITWG